MFIQILAENIRTCYSSIVGAELTSESQDSELSESCSLLLS